MLYICILCNIIYICKSISYVVVYTLPLHMRMYMSVYIYCVCVCVCVCVCAIRLFGSTIIYIYIYIYTHTHTHTRVGTHLESCGGRRGQEHQACRRSRRSMIRAPCRRFSFFAVPCLGWSGSGARRCLHITI